MQAKEPLANDLSKKKRGQAGSDTESGVDEPLARKKKRLSTKKKYSFGRSSSSDSDEEEKEKEKEEEPQKKSALEEEGDDDDDDDDAEIRTIKRDHWVIDYGALKSKHIYEVQYVSGEFPLRFDHLLCAL